MSLIKKETVSFFEIFLVRAIACGKVMVMLRTHVLFEIAELKYSILHLNSLSSINC